MHFRAQFTRHCPSQAPPTVFPKVMNSKHGSTTILTTEIEPSPQVESRLETPGISSWDFAYPTGKCNLPASLRKNCFISKCFMHSVSEQHHTTIQPTTLFGAQSALQQEKSSKTKKHFHSTKPSTSDSDIKTYLLSSPTFQSLVDPQVHDTVSTLLSQPNTKLVYLVPQSNICCPKVCEVMRLPPATGSSIRILPVEPKVWANPDKGIDMVSGVEEVVGKIVKNTKVKAFDGFMSFEEDREAWTFLEAVGKGVKERAFTKKG